MQRLLRAYGTELIDILGTADKMSDLSVCFGASLTEKEVRWLLDKEWAQTAEDILWRRSKLGLRFNEAQYDGLEQWLHSNAQKAS